MNTNKQFAKAFFSSNLNSLYKEKNKLCNELNMLLSQKHIYQNTNDLDLFNLKEQKYKLDIEIQEYKINKLTGKNIINTV